MEWLACAGAAVAVGVLIWRVMRQDQQRFDALTQEQQNEEWERDAW